MGWVVLMMVVMVVVGKTETLKYSSVPGKQYRKLGNERLQGY